ISRHTRARLRGVSQETPQVTATILFLGHLRFEWTTLFPARQWPADLLHSLKNRRAPFLPVGERPDRRDAPVGLAVKKEIGPWQPCGRCAVRRDARVQMSQNDGAGAENDEARRAGCHGLHCCTS